MLTAIRSGAARYLSSVFVPPRAFPDREAEAAFRRDYAARYRDHRRATAVLALLTWTLFIGWDIFHASRNFEFARILVPILALRLVGCAALIGAVALTFRAAFEEEAYASLLLSLAVTAAYGLLLVMIVIVPFPLNYMYYYIGLLLVLIFMFGLLRLRAGPVYLLNAIFVVVTGMVLPYAATRSVLMSFPSVTGYYYLSAMSYLICFTAVGCAVAAELERSARNAYTREHELARNAEAFARQNRQLEALNQSILASERETVIKTEALVAAKEELRLQAERENLNKSKFLADAAHDLRQPMQALSSLLEAAGHAIRTGDTENAADLLKMAEDASRLTRASFNAVLDISRLESGFVQAEPSLFRIEDLLDEVLSAERAAAAARGVNLRLRASRETGLVVRSDRHLLGRVLTNLISNAIKYSDPARPKPAVVVGVVAFSGRVRIDIVDNGLGIPRDRWDDIFQPFVQLRNPARDREKGLGLGLSIVGAIMPLLNEHRIDMRSVEGQGTRFSLELPRVDAPADDEAGPRAAEAGAADLSGLYVFYVEDDLLVRRATQALFKAWGVLSEAAGSLEEARRLAAGLERAPDVVVSDYRLPDEQTARDVIALIRAEFGDETPLVLLTGEVAAFADEAWLEGAQILRKPVSPETLQRALAAASAGAPTPAWE